MTKRVALVGMLVLATGACVGGGAGPSEVPADSAVVVLSSANFQQLVLENQQPSLVEFQQPNCSACQSMTQTVEDLARSYRGRALVGSVDVTVQRDLSQRYEIWGTPTFIVFRDGQERDRHVGATSYAELARLLDAAM